MAQRLSFQWLSAFIAFFTQTHDSKEHLAMMERILGPLPTHMIKKSRYVYYGSGKLRNIFSYKRSCKVAIVSCELLQITEIHGLFITLRSFKELTVVTFSDFSLNCQPLEL